MVLVWDLMPAVLGGVESTDLPDDMMLIISECTSYPDSSSIRYASESRRYMTILGHLIRGQTSTASLSVQSHTMQPSLFLVNPSADKTYEADLDEPVPGVYGKTLVYSL